MTPAGRAALIRGLACTLALTVLTISAVVPAGASTDREVANQSDLFGALPGPSSTPAPGGTVRIAETPAAGPAYIFPVTPAADFSVFDTQQFQDYQWRPLWWVPRGATPTIDFTQSIAGPPAFSNDGRTVTITLNPHWRWSDGTPVTAQDIAFDIAMVKAAVRTGAAAYANYTPGLFPDLIASVSTPKPTTVVLRITRSYNRSYLLLDQLSQIVPLPAQAWARTRRGGPPVPFTDPTRASSIYRFLNTQAENQATYASNPLWQVVDGPFRLSSFDPATDANTMVVNRRYAGPVRPRVSAIDDVAEISPSTEMADLLDGSLTIGYLDPSGLGQVPALEAEGYSVWGGPDFSADYVAYNFKDTTGDFDRIIAQRYVRQALAHLQDEPAVIESPTIFDGAAVPSYGPVPSAPSSPFTSSTNQTDPYPFSIETAAALLTSHGWHVVPGGFTTCESPGTGPHECGAGIPAGTPMNWNLLRTNTPPTIGAEDAAFAANAREVGITITLSAKTFDYLVAHYSDATDPANEDQWAMEDFGGVTDEAYPTSSQLFATGGALNVGGYSDRTADADFRRSLHSSGPALSAEVSYLEAQQPGLFQPVPDLLFASRTTLAGPTSSFAEATQDQFGPEYWYFVAP